MAHYLNLSVDMDATPEQIKKSYQKLCLRYHPDKNPDGAQIFMQIDESYKILSNEHVRTIYDYGVLPGYLKSKERLNNMFKNNKERILAFICYPQITTNYTTSDLSYDIDNENIDKIVATLVKAYYDKDETFQKSYVNIILAVGIIELAHLGFKLCKYALTGYILYSDFRYIFY